MYKFKFDTSLHFPFYKINELVTYSEVKKPTGVSYILLVLIRESKDRNAYLLNVLENFGVPKSLHQIFIDEIYFLTREQIINYTGEYSLFSEIDQCTIGDFEFTDKGKKVFAEESIPTGINKEIKIPLFYDIAKNELMLKIKQDLEPKPLFDCALSPDFYDSFKCNKDIEVFLNLHKGKDIPIKKEEIIIKTESLPDNEKWTVKQDCEILINGTSLEIKFEDPLLQKFVENYYSNEILTKAISYKSRFKFESKFTEHISINDFDSGKIEEVLIPKGLEEVLKKKSKLFFTKGNYSSNTNLLIKDDEPINQLNAYFEFIQVESNDSIFAYVPATFDFESEKFGLITLPLVLKIRLTNEELKKVIALYFKTRSQYSEELFNELTILTNITKDYSLSDSMMEGYMSDNSEGNLVRLNEMKPIAIKNPNILSKHKELTNKYYLDYLHNCTEENLETVLKVTKQTPKYLSLNQEEVLALIFSNKKPFERKVRVYESLIDNGFSRSSTLLFVNPVEEALKEKTVEDKSLIDLVNFDELISNLKTLSGIADYKSYSFDEENINKNEFKKNYTTAYSLFKNIQIFKDSNPTLFSEYNGFMAIFEAINNYFNLLDSALQSPANIKPEIIEKKTVNGEYQFVFVNLSAKLETILKTKFNLLGTLSDMLSEARDTGIIDKAIVSDLHTFRDNRNSLIHPDKRAAKFTIDDLRRWSKEIFDLEEVNSNESSSNS